MIGGWLGLKSDEGLAPREEFPAAGDDDDAGDKHQETVEEASPVVGAAASDEAEARLLERRKTGILVKLPVGSKPIEMWITVPLDLDCRPTEVLACVTKQLAVTRVATRRCLSPGGLMLVALDGSVLSQAVSLSKSGVRLGDVVLVLPSARRQRFLFDELKQHVDACMQEEAEAASDEEDAISGDEVVVYKKNEDEEEDDAWALRTRSTVLHVGVDCWVSVHEDEWRQASIVSVGKEFIVRWSTVSERIDEPGFAQVERNCVSLRKPAMMKQLVVGKRKEQVWAPLALREDGALRVQLVWRLGLASEALAMWLRVPPPYGREVKPRQLLKAFVEFLTKERPRLRWTLDTTRFCISTLDAAPLCDDTAVATSLKALCRRRALCAGQAADDDQKTDDFAQTWGNPETAAEETLLVLPRIDRLGVGPSSRKQPEKEEEVGLKWWLEALKGNERRAWIVEKDGSLTACTLKRGANAPVRNRLANNHALREVIEITSVHGGDAIVVHVDRLGGTLRQVKLSQLRFEDEQGGSFVEDVVNGIPSFNSILETTGLIREPDEVNIDEAELKKSKEAEHRDKSLLQEVLPEFRRNGILIVTAPVSKKHEVFKCDFHFVKLGISLVLAISGGTSTVVVVEAVLPSCPPSAQLRISVGDELLAVDGADVDCTDEDGYNLLIARLRCGARPTQLSFRKAADTAPFPARKAYPPPPVVDEEAALEDLFFRRRLATTPVVEEQVTELNPSSSHVPASSTVAVVELNASRVLASSQVAVVELNPSAHVASSSTEDALDEKLNELETNHPAMEFEVDLDDDDLTVVASPRYNQRSTNPEFSEDLEHEEEHEVEAPPQEEEEAVEEEAPPTTTTQEEEEEERGTCLPALFKSTPTTATDEEEEEAPPPTTQGTCLPISLFKGTPGSQATAPEGE